MMVLFLFFSGSMMMFAAAKRNKRGSHVKYFSKNSLYIYGMAALNNFDAPAEYWEDWDYDTADGVAPMAGIGFRAFNFGNRLFVNLEFDFMPTRFDMDAWEHKVDFYTAMINMEGRFFNSSPVTLLFGIGVGFIDMKDQWVWDHFEDDTRVTLALELGFKFPVMKKLFFRGGLRFYSEVYPDYDGYYYDEYGNEYNDTNLDRLATTVMLGLEFHF